MVKKLTISVLLLVHLSSCYLGYEKLVTKPTNPITQLKLGGYYYCADNEGNFPFYFIYSNGVTFGYYSLSKKQESNIDSFFAEKNYINRKVVTSLQSTKEWVCAWGILNIQNDIIFQERWEPCPPFQKIPTYIIKGRILNDTTFVLEEKLNRRKEFLFDLKNDTFRFKRHDFKPDSTNNFIK